MLRICNIVAVASLVLQGCSAWKDGMVAQGDANDAIVNAITDMCHRYRRLVRADSAFSVEVVDLSDDMLRIDILGETSKFIVIGGVEFNTESLPTRFYESNGKQFFWKDPKMALSQEILEKLSQYHRVDSVESIGLAVFTIDHTKSGATYYMCKANLMNYKTLVTRKIPGTYPPPPLTCKVRERK